MTLISLKNIDWKLLRGTTIWAISCFVIGLVSLIMSYEHKLYKEETTQRHKVQLSSMNSKTNKALRDGETYQMFLPKLQRFMDEGFIGEQNRVIWVDILREISSKLKIPNLQYNISEQSRYTHKGKALPPGNFLINKSVMRISLSIFHEGDLFAILNALKNQSKALYFVDQCAIHRTRSSNMEQYDEPRLNLQCDLIWITLQYSEFMSDEISNLNENEEI